MHIIVLSNKYSVLFIYLKTLKLLLRGKALPVAQNNTPKHYTFWDSKIDLVKQQCLLIIWQRLDYIRFGNFKKLTSQNANTDTIYDL